MMKRRNPQRVDFRLYWAGETISSLGSSFTLLALPLLVYRLTGSALNLGLSTAAETLPYLLLGLLIGAWVDRLDRKRLMIVIDLLQALTIATIPVVYALGVLSVWWMYGVGFVSATLKIGFESGQFAAIPHMVNQDNLDAANGRIQASFSLAQMLGPVLAGALLFILPLPTLLLLDAASFLISAGALRLIRTRFNTTASSENKSIRQEVGEGLRYVLKSPPLRAMVYMTLLLNPILITTTTQLVLLASVAYHAGNQQISLFYAAGSLGVVLFSLLAGPLRTRWPFSRVAMGSLLLMGGLLLGLGFTPWYPLAVVVWGLSQGTEMLFNINTRSLCQAIVPDQLLGRVMSVLLVLAYAVIPLGALGGGILLQQTGVTHVAQVYAAIGLLIVLVALAFSLTALGHAERYLPASLAAASSRSSSSRWKTALRALLAGMWTTVPLALPIIPYIALYGLTARASGLSELSTLAFSLLVFSGAILPAIQSLQAGTPLLVVVGMIAVLNLRQMLYGAKLAPRLVGLRLRWRLLVCYSLTDESFGALMRRVEEHGWDWRCWPFLIGSGAMMWLAAQGATLLGLSVGAQLPTSLALDFLPTLAFLCFMVLSIKGIASVLAALAAGGAAVWLQGLPLRLGTLAAILIGISVGVITQHVRRSVPVAWSKEGKAWQSGS
jgi:predicted branched-subunit amino acid permease